MLQLHIGIVTWCWPLWGPLCSPFDPLLRVGRFTQTHLPFWMTVPDNGPISSLTPSHPQIFPLSCPITFSPPLQNCFNFGVVGWPPPCSWGDLWLKPLPANLHKPDNHHQCHHHPFGPNNLFRTQKTNSMFFCHSKKNDHHPQQSWWSWCSWRLSRKGEGVGGKWD